MKKLTFHRKTAGLYQNFTVQEMLWHTCHRTLVLPMRMPLLYILPYSFSLPFPPCFMLLHLPLSHMPLHWTVTSPYTLPASLSASSWLIHYLRSHYTMRDLITRIPLLSVSTMKLTEDKNVLASLNYVHKETAAFTLKTVLITELAKYKDRGEYKGVMTYTVKYGKEDKEHQPKEDTPWRSWEWCWRHCSS